MRIYFYEKSLSNKFKLHILLQYELKIIILITPNIFKAKQIMIEHRITIKQEYCLHHNLSSCKSDYV